MIEFWRRRYLLVRKSCVKTIQVGFFLLFLLFYFSFFFYSEVLFCFYIIYIYITKTVLEFIQYTNHYFVLYFYIYIHIHLPNPTIQLSSGRISST